MYHPKTVAFAFEIYHIKWSFSKDTQYQLCMAFFFLYHSFFDSFIRCSDNVISTLPAFVKRELNELRISRREQLSLVDFVERGANKNCL